MNKYFESIPLQAPFFGGDLAGIDNFRDFSAADGINLKDMSDEQKAQLAQAAAATASLIANRRQNEYKQALKQHCGRKPLLKKGKNRQKWEDYKACAEKFAKTWAQRNKDVSQSMIDNTTRQFINDPDEESDDKIWGMPKPVVYVGGVLILGLAVWGIYKLATKGK